jgi:hypothetical protein
VIIIRATIEEKDKAKLEAMRDRAQGRMIDWARWGLQQARQSVVLEFSATEWKMPGGGVYAWPPRKKKAQGHPLLKMFPADHAEKHGGARSLLDSYIYGLHGFFKGGFWFGSNVPYAAVQRGGKDENPGLVSLHRNIPPRPHATDNPRLHGKLETGLRNFIIFGDPTRSVVA